MKLPETSEWVLHTAAMLAQLPAGAVVSGAQLTEHFGVPGAYLSKQLAKLVRAGILTGTTGPRGGFRLAREPDRISILDLVAAVDGAADPYICRELRQHGRGAARAEDCTRPCALASAMRAAHEAWRDALARVTLAHIVATLPESAVQKNRDLLLHSTGQTR